MFTHLVGHVAQQQRHHLLDAAGGRVAQRARLRRRRRRRRRQVRHERGGRALRQADGVAVAVVGAGEQQRQQLLRVRLPRGAVEEVVQAQQRARPRAQFL